MKRRALTRSAALGVLALASSGCGIKIRQGGASRDGVASAAPGDVSRIDVETAFARVQAGAAVLVDVRGADSFQRKRAAGAILLALDDIERDPAAAARAVPAGKLPILYCT